MNGKLISSTPRDEINAFAFQSSFVYECYTQIHSILNSKLSEKHANLFAEPVFNNLSNTFDWYAPIEGEAKLLSTCPQEEQNTIRLHLATLAQEIAECAQKLKESPGNSQVIASNILNLALQYPDENTCIYIIDDQPILICWGFEPAKVGANAQDLRRLSPLTASLNPKAPIMEAIKIPQEEIPKNDAQKEKKAFIFNWAWLIWLIIILLLLSLAFLLFSGRLSLPNFSLTGVSSPSISPPEVSLNKLGIPKLSNPKLDALYLELEKTRELCLSNKPKVKDKKLPIINAPKNVQSLQGAWICETDIVTSDNAPVVMKFTFDNEGIGQVLIDVNGNICTATTKGHFKSSSAFTITTDTEIICQNGNAFAKQSIACVNTEKGTICNGRNLNDQSTWGATFHRDIN